MGVTVPKTECLDGILASPARGVGGEWGAAMSMQYHTLSKPPSEHQEHCWEKFAVK